MQQCYRIELTVGRGSNVLDRVVGLCRARQCRILALQFEVGDLQEAGRVSLTLEGSPTRVRLVVSRLRALVDVVDLYAARADAPASMEQEAGRC